MFFWSPLVLIHEVFYLENIKDLLAKKIIPVDGEQVL